MVNPSDRGRNSVETSDPSDGSREAIHTFAESLDYYEVMEGRLEVVSENGGAEYKMLAADCESETYSNGSVKVETPEVVVEDFGGETLRVIDSPPEGQLNSWSGVRNAEVITDV